MMMMRIGIEFRIFERWIRITMIKRKKIALMIMMMMMRRKKIEYSQINDLNEWIFRNLATCCSCYCCWLLCKIMNQNEKSNDWVTIQKHKIVAKPPPPPPQQQSSSSLLIIRLQRVWQRHGQSLKSSSSMRTKWEWRMENDFGQ